MNKRGFTLVELLATIVLLSIISVISYVSISSVIKKNKVNNCRNLIKSIEGASREYVSDNRYKIYNHKLYKLLLTDIPESMKDSIFEINGVKYSWMLFEELEADLNTMQKNDDVIAFVKSKL